MTQSKTAESRAGDLYRELFGRPSYNEDLNRDQHLALIASAITQAEDEAEQAWLEVVNAARSDRDATAKDGGDFRQGVCEAIGMHWLGPEGGCQRLPDDKDIIAACAELFKSSQQGT